MTKQDMIELAKRRAAYRQTAEYRKAVTKRKAQIEERLQREVDDVGSPNAI